MEFIVCLLSIAVALQSILVLSLAIRLGKVMKVNRLIFDFINKTHTNELFEFLCERNEKELEEIDKKKNRKG